MSQSKITLIGLEQFLNPDHSVFENLILPDGIDKDTLTGTILLRCQEFELLYPDPEFMTAAVNVWGRKNYWTFDKWVKLLDKQYDPLFNKDYYEEITDKHTGSATSSGNTKENDDHTRTDNLASSISGTDTHSEKAYNDTNYVGTTKDDTSSGSTQTGTVKNAGNTSGSYDNKNSDSYTNKHNYHGFGNIGITSAQELFLKEVDVARFNLYSQIADLFCQEFCIMVY